MSSYTQPDLHMGEQLPHTVQALVRRAVLNEVARIVQYPDDLAACERPALMVVGDEDDLCFETNLFVKRTMRASQLRVVTGNGHAVNHRLTR